MIVQCGLEIPEWAKNSGLLELVPEDVKHKIDQNPSLETYEHKLHYVRLLLRDHKGVKEVAQMTAKNPDAMSIGSVEPGHHQGGHDDDWNKQFANMAEQIVASFMKGKGKGKGKNNTDTFGKGGAAKFDGDCNYCGKHGHKKAECRLRISDEAKGIFQNKAKGQTKGSWAKGWQKGGVNAVDSSDQGGDWIWQPKEESKTEDLEPQAPWQIAHVGVKQPPGLTCQNPWSVLSEPECRGGVTEDEKTNIEREHAAFPLLGTNIKKKNKNNGCYIAKDKNFNNKIGKNIHHLGGIHCLNEKKKEEHVMAMNMQDKKYHYKEVLIDSGACESVAPPGEFPDYEIAESQGQRDGIAYVSASGKDIPNEGQKVIPARTEDKTSCIFTFQMAKVTRPILAVSRICQQGNEVEFSQDGKGGVIRHVSSRKEIPFIKKNGVYVLRLWIPKVQGFHRQE